MTELVFQNGFGDLFLTLGPITTGQGMDTNGHKKTRKACFKGLFGFL